MYLYLQVYFLLLPAMQLNVHVQFFGIFLSNIVTTQKLRAYYLLKAIGWKSVFMVEISPLPWQIFLWG